MYALQPEPEAGRRWRLLTATALLTLFGATALLTFTSQLRFPKPASRPAPRRIQMVHRPAAAPTPPPVEVPPTPAPPKATPKPPRPKKAKSAPTRKPPPKPMPAVAPPPPTPVKPPPPLVVGLTLSSTTSSGNGPRFAVGNTLMGAPDSVASEPIAAPMVRTPSAPKVESANRSLTKKRTAAKLRSGSSPHYPAAAKRDGIEGVVVLSITIGSKGHVLSAQVLKGLLPALDESALRAAKNTLWTPATADGRPTQSTRRFNVRFSLQG